MANAPDYTHLDIARYLDNQMTRQEMYAFEKAMLDDPFLAEAFEGYASTNRQQSIAHVTDLKQRIANRHTTARVVALPRNRFSWWKVAVLVLLVAGAGIMLFRINNNTGTSREIAQLKETGLPIPKADTIGPTTAVNSPAREFIPQKNTTILMSKPSSKALDQSNAAVTASDLKLADSTNPANALALTRQYDEVATLKSAPEARAAEAEKRIATMAAPAPLLEYKGKVLDPEGEPLPFATILINKNEGTVADAKGRFSFKAQDTAVAVSITAPGYLTTNARLSALTRENAVVVNEKQETDLAEVVVTAMMRKKQLAATRERIRSKSNGLEPIKGWKHYNTYISEFLTDMEENDAALMKGEIQLEFSLDKKGRPTDIKIIKQATDTQVQYAIELLKKGPSFRQTSDTGRVRIHIMF